MSMGVQRSGKATLGFFNEEQSMVLKNNGGIFSLEFFELEMGALQIWAT